MSQLPDSLQILTLQAVEIPVPGNYPSTWVSNVKDWMKQWSVENNYDPILIRNRRVNPALKVWAETFLSMVHQNFDNVMPSYAKESLNVAEAFRFQYFISEDLSPNETFVLRDTKMWVMLDTLY